MSISPPIQGPVRGRPADIARLRKEALGQFHAGQVPEEKPVRVQHALGIAGGAGGVDHHRRVLGSGVDRSGGGWASDELVEGEDGRAGRPRGDKGAERGQIGGGKRDDARQRGGIRDDGRRAAVEEAGSAARSSPKRVKSGNETAPSFHRGEMGDQHGGMLRQQDGDAVPAPDAAGGQGRGERVGGAPEAARRSMFSRGVIGMAVDDRDAVGRHHRPVVATGARDVEPARYIPAEGRVQILPSGALSEQAPIGRVRHRR